jgi:hypothetical protein
MSHFASYFLAQQLICYVHVCIFFHPIGRRILRLTALTTKSFDDML